MAIPIGWVLADLTGYGHYFRHMNSSCRRITHDVIILYRLAD